MDGLESRDEFAVGVGSPVELVEAAPVRSALWLPPSWLAGTASRESFRRLAAVVGRGQPDPCVTGVVSVAEGEGRSWVVSGLACAIAELGDTVIALDANSARVSLPAIFGLPGSVAKRETSEFLARLLVGDAWNGDGAAERSPERTSMALAAVRRRAHRVLVELEPLRYSAQSLTLAPLVDSVLVVVEASRERREVVGHAIAGLERAGLSVVGVVINKRERPIPDFVYRRL